MLKMFLKAIKMAAA